jgi:hypothetical protein
VRAEINVGGHRVVSLEARFPGHGAPPPLPSDPMEGLKALVAEYAAASNRERNYGSNRFAHLMWSYLTELMPVIEQRRADRWAQTEAAIDRFFAAADGRPPPPPPLRAIQGGKP